MASTPKYFCLACNREFSNKEAHYNECKDPNIQEISYAPPKDHRPSNYKPHSLKSGFDPQNSPLQEQGALHNRRSNPENGMRATEGPYSPGRVGEVYDEYSTWTRVRPCDCYCSNDYYLEYRRVPRSRMAERFIGFVDRDLDSPQGVSMSTALSRFHHSLDIFGLGPTTAAGRLARERPLWRNLRMRRNEYGEVELLV